MGGELEVTDVRSKCFAMSYSALNSCYWAPSPSNTYLQAFLRVNHNGRLGYGGATDRPEPRLPDAQPRPLLIAQP